MYFQTCNSMPLILELMSIWKRKNNSGAQQATHIWETKGNPWVDFLTVITASGIARGRVRTTAATTTVESRNMAAILQKTGWHAALVYCVLLWYWISADQYYVTILRAQVTTHRGQVFFWPLTRCWFFDWIAGSCLVNLLKTEQDCSEAG